jgi:hypothetical protein
MSVMSVAESIVASALLDELVVDELDELVAESSLVDVEELDELAEPSPEVSPPPVSEVSPTEVSAFGPSPLLPQATVCSEAITTRLTKQVSVLNLRIILLQGERPLSCVRVGFDPFFAHTPQATCLLRISE